ncbi:MAG TPA: hypothetical protein PLZ61_05835, partial [Candidatus Cryosericum sp.]|nr:hypothetical protein [Candidatus Cryosericum sp.]
PGCGYWIQCSAAGSRIVVGAPVASPVDLSVAAGWNLIGDPFNTSVSVADITNWDKVAHCYTLEHGTWTAVDLNSGSLEPGLGYWVELTQATTLGVTQP